MKPGIYDFELEIRYSQKMKQGNIYLVNLHISEKQ